MSDDDRIKAATRAVKEELMDYPDARQSSWNIAAAALRAAGMDAAMRELLEAVRDAMTLPPGQKRDDATDVVYAVLHVLLDDNAPSVASQVQWLREQMAAILIGGGPSVLARRTIAELTIPAGTPNSHDR